MTNYKNIYIFNHWWNLNNYGAILTAFSLQQIIASMNYESKLVNDMQQNLISFVDRHYTFSLPFKKNYLKITESSINNNSLLSLNETANCYITGSDQVFRPQFLKGRTQEYLLDFAECDKKKIAFSASFGIEEKEFIKNTTQKEINHYRKSLKSFDFISVREKSGVAICKNIIGVDAQWIIDPVFIIEKSNYDPLIENLTVNYKNKIVAYVLDEKKDYEKAFKYLSKKYNKKVVKTANSNISVENWLASIKNCDLFITDSFHGMCYAIIFNKPFICIANKSRGNARFESICEMLDIENKCITSILEVMQKDCVFNIEYEKVNKRIEEERNKGLSFLKVALEVPVKNVQEKLDVRVKYLEEQVRNLEKENCLSYQIKKSLWNMWLFIYYGYLPNFIKFTISFLRKIVKKVKKNNA